MTIDHVAWLFVPLSAPAGQAMHIIGRLTAPIMCFLIAEGYYHTKSFSNYILRLGVFAVLSHLPFVFYSTGKLSFLLNGYFETSVMFPLLLGLAALAVAKSKAIHTIFKLLIIAVIMFLATYGDWQYIAVLWVLVFGLTRDNKAIMALLFCCVSVASFIGAAIMSPSPASQLFQLGTLLALPLFLLYNGRRGKFKLKYFFYVYYPLHMIVIRFFAV